MGRNHKTGISSCRFCTDDYEDSRHRDDGIYSPADASGSNTCILISYRYFILTKIPLIP
ncbi:MAG: hypothetical protein JXA44_03150 [Methanospirillaceae archaeon]|nr:hypothetical protein [Methanospirillaceae archaeon]